LVRNSAVPFDPFGSKLDRKLKLLSLAICKDFSDKSRDRPGIKMTGRQRNAGNKIYKTRTLEGLRTMLAFTEICKYCPRMNVLLNILTDKNGNLKTESAQ
jgi:hypothetical protein